MSAEEYLQRIEKLDSMIANRIEDHHRWVEIANGLGGFSGEKVSSGRSLDKIPNAVAKYCDIEKEIDGLKAERKAIIDKIENLPTWEYRVIYSLYVKGLTIKECAYSFKPRKSTEFVKKHKHIGLALIGEMIK